MLVDSGVALDVRLEVDLVVRLYVGWRFVFVDELVVFGMGEFY